MLVNECVSLFVVCARYFGCNYVKGILWVVHVGGLANCKGGCQRGNEGRMTNDRKVLARALVYNSAS